MKDILIVDGYNVVNAWPELAALKDNNLEHARDRLIESILSYSAYREYRAYIVFDAHEASGADRYIQFMGHLEVVYTKEGETADSYIEKLTYGLVRQGRRVYVVTSDWAEQILILWAGAYRISARELLKDYKSVKREMKDYSRSGSNNLRHEISDRLNDDIIKRLDELRKSR